MIEGNSAKSSPASADSGTSARHSPWHSRSAAPLLIGLAVVIAFFLTSSLMGYFKIRTLRENSQKVAHTHEVIVALGDILALVTDAETGQRGYLLTGDREYLQPYTEALRKIDVRMEDLAKLIADNPEQQARFQTLKGDIEVKQAELAESVQARRDNGLDAALAIVRSDRGKLAMDTLRQDVALMISVEQSLRNRRLMDAGAAFRTAVWSTVSVSLVGLILAAVITWILRKAELTKQRHEWIQTGQLRLAEHLLGEQKINELAGNALRFLSEYLGAQAGAIYIENEGIYQRFATYAVPSESDIPKQVKLGEGLLGQVAKDGKPVAVNDVPEGYLSIGSALGQRVPRHLLIVPATIDGAVNAVIEFGFFNPIPDNGVELLSRAGETIATAVRSAKYRARVQELLEETQAQSEEVQAQSEELRVSNEELEEQTRALKESQATLEEQQAALEQTNSQLELQTKILARQKEDLHRATTTLEKQARAVEQASRYKSEFLANMSHELRTPLNSSLILAKLLSDNKGGNLTAEQVKYAQTIQSAGNDLLGLINEVLDLSKVESGHIEILPEPVYVKRLMENLRGLFEPSANQKGVVFRTHISPKVPANLVTDSQRLEQVLKNLLSNALKFTERGEVTFSIDRDADGRLAFAVRDTGIGIAAEQQHIIFEPFRQGDGTTNRKYGGTGLGLSISRELVRLLGGEIQLSSEAGKGSVFTVLLPEIYGGAADAPGAEINPSLPDQVPELPSTPSASRPAAVPLAPRIPDDRERLNGNGRFILIVEDDEPFVGIVSDLAHEMSFQCLVATTAEEALTLTRQYLPSAIVLDLGLPDNSGLFVLERLKQDARTRHIPVHVVSASDYTDKALSMGAVGYMLKPIKREQLAQAFERLELRLTQKLHRILIVEDNEVQMESLRLLLGSGGVETVGARTAAECLEQLKKTTFDCMVLDLTLPDASGFSLLETLSANEDYSFPPVIVYTARELSAPEEQRLRKYSKSIIIKGAKSPERLLDEVTLFLHQVVSELPEEKQIMLEKVRGRDDTLAGKHILLVEDDVRNVFALTSVFEPYGVKLTVARNGREALDTLTRSSEGAASVDLVLMDLMMPEMDGMTAMREIRKRPEWKKLPIIALTAKAMRNDREQSLDAGANDYLAKPLDVEKLLSLVRVWMPR